MIRATSPTLDSIRRKVEAGERLSFDDGMFLERPDVPLPEVGELANLVRERKNGNRTYYNINTHLNPTNVCVYRCTFCAFRSDLRDPKGYLMSDEQILARGQEAVDCGATEMHIVGGLHHQMKYDWYVHLIRVLHDAYPRLHLKAWTAVELDWFARTSGKPIRAVLEDMIDTFWENPLAFAFMVHDKFREPMLDVFAGRIYEGQPTRGLDEAMMVFRRLLKRERAYDDQTLFSVPIGSRYHPERAPLWNSELSTVEGTEAWIRDNG